MPCYCTDGVSQEPVVVSDYEVRTCDSVFPKYKGLAKWAGNRRWLGFQVTVLNGAHDINQNHRICAVTAPGRAA